MVTKVFKSLNHLNPELLWNSFVLKPNVYHLRQGPSLAIPRGQTTCTINSFDFRAALAWNNLPLVLKLEKSLYIANASIVDKFSSLILIF